jgi:hypothetical protein
MTKLIKIVDEIDVNPILESFYKLESYIQWTDYPTTKQTGLQYRNGNEPWSDGAGSGLKWPQYESGSSAYSSDNPNLNKTWYENISINPFFKETIFEEIINKYDMVRTRLIWVKPFSCYSFHKDTSPRLHLPLITNPQCFFVFKDIPVYHMSAGNLYWSDTTKPHTFINCSNQPRLHLISLSDFRY